jgi:hypothetical protein
MATPTLGTSQQIKDQAPKRQNGFLAGFRDLLEIIRDYGMPTVAFGTGIYAFIEVLRLPMAAELKTAVALALTLLGLLAQLWIYSRTNPRVQSDEVKNQLQRMTELVERLVEIIIKEKADRGQ